MCVSAFSAVDWKKSKEWSEEKRKSGERFGVC
jgi:hypothetical protein